MRAFSISLAVAGMTVFSTALLGCGTSPSAFCDRVCECTGCNEAERAECVDDVEDTQKAADEANCSSEFDDYLGCVDSELECNSGNVKADGCGSELTALFKCGVAGGNGEPTDDTTGPGPAPGG